VPEIDEHLRGASAGDVLEFTAAHPDPDEDDLEFRIQVNEVQEKVLPEPTDEWATEASEFDTLGELRADLAQRASTMKVLQAQMALREKAADALGDLVDTELPEALITSEMQNRVQDMAMRLQAQGASLEQYLQATGRSQEDFLAELRESAAPAVRADLALRAVVEAEAIEATDVDLEAEYAGLAERVEQPIESVREQLERAGQISALRSDIKKRKALEWIIERVEIVDDDGNVIDRADLELPADEADLDTDAPGADVGHTDAATGEPPPDADPADADSKESE
jgi:trigger factor